MSTETYSMNQPPNWSTIMQDHRGWLASVVYARLRDQHAVEEVLQETALAASKHSILAPDQQGVCKWLYRVALRQTLLYRRQQFRNQNKIKQAGDVGRVNKDPIASEDNPYLILLATERQELVQSALGMLAAKDVEVLMLKYRDGWSCCEMAERLDVSESAMKSRLLRARNNLRKELIKFEDNWDLT